VKIHVHVGKIVLHGLPVSHLGAPAIASAIEAELARLLRMHGLSAELQQGGRVPGVPKPSFQLAAANSPSSLGINIAQSVFGTLGGNSLLKSASASARRRGSAKAVLTAVGSAR
jgi:hypothetical protein